MSNKKKENKKVGTSNLDEVRGASERETESSSSYGEGASERSNKEIRQVSDSEDCLTGACPTPQEPDEALVKLSEGSGGRDMLALLDTIAERLPYRGDWDHTDNDSATLKIADDKYLVFTTDTYVVTPAFFPGGNIGKLAFCGTVNDLAMMGARPLGLSMGLVLEESMPKSELNEIIDTIGKLSKEHKIPVATGDTKVMERGALDKIVINTSGVGIVEKPLQAKLKPGDKIIFSGGIGEHGTALLAKRFELETDLKTDSKPLHEEIEAVKDDIKQARDITRGGVAAVLNELAGKAGVKFFIEEEIVPMKSQVFALTEILGIEVYNLACEGRFVCFASADKADAVVKKLKKFNDMATIIGEVQAGENVEIQTRFGKKLLSMPIGELVPRIC
jgi:hydrogenase expression/formation protein HypE